MKAYGAGRNSNNPHEFSVCMGMDAMRLCLGLPGRNFTVDEVIRWLCLVQFPTPAGRAALEESKR